MWEYNKEWTLDFRETVPATAMCAFVKNYLIIGWVRNYAFTSPIPHNGSAKIFLQIWLCLTNLEKFWSSNHFIRPGMNFITWHTLFYLINDDKASFWQLALIRIFILFCRFLKNADIFCKTSGVGTFDYGQIRPWLYHV